MLRDRMAGSHGPQVLRQGTHEPGYLAELGSLPLDSTILCMATEPLQPRITTETDRGRRCRLQVAERLDLLSVGSPDSCLVASRQVSQLAYSGLLWEQSLGYVAVAPRTPETAPVELLPRLP